MSSARTAIDAERGAERFARLGLAKTSLLAVGLLLVASPARAETTPDHLARTLSADPNAPAMRFSWRGALRGTASIAIPILDPETGFQLTLLPLIELHNEPGSSVPVPFELWRGRASLEAAYRWRLDPPERSAWLVVGGALEHESDHITVRPAEPLTFGALPAGLESDEFVYVGFENTWVYYNDLALFGSITLPLGTWAMTALVKERVHFASCTSPDVSCGRVQASFALETEVGLVFEMKSYADPKPTFVPYASLTGSILPNMGNTLEELRLSAEVGVGASPSSLGMFRAYLAMLLGNDVSVFRYEQVAHFGAGIAWAL